MNQKRENKALGQITELDKTAKMKRLSNKTPNMELTLFPDIKTILDYIKNEHYPTISSISRQFKMHRMTASEIVGKLERHGLVFTEQVGSAKIVKIIGE